MKRLLLALAALLFVGAASAATTADRSPLTQGLWWDATKPGHGFEIFNNVGELSIFWYTYEANGSPTWYTAQGRLADAGSAYPLLKFKWANGKASYDIVGSLRLNIINSEAATVSYQLGADTGTWTIQPFQVAGVVNEVDHDGVWFNPANSGWGLSVLEQGDVLGGALYYYAPDGSPTWVAGFTKGSKTVQYYAYRGTCPACAYSPPSAQPAGTVTFDFSSETAAKLRSSLLTAPAAGVNIDGAAITQLGRPASTRPADRQLAAYASADALKAYLVKGVGNVLAPTCNCTPFSAAPPSAPPTAFSATNVQEQGVDEADYLKTDGRLLYTFQTTGPNKRTAVVRIGEVAANAGGVALRGTYSLASGGPADWAGLMIAGTGLVSITGTQVQVQAGNSGWATSAAWSNGTTNVEIMDAHAAPALATLWRVSLDGHPISSRRVGDRLYVASRYVPVLPGYGNAAVVYASNSSLDALLPKMRVNGGNPVPLAPSDVLAPPAGSAAPIADFIVITTIDLASPRVVQRVAILGAAEAFYVSPGNAYVATARRPFRNSAGFYIPPANGDADYTDVHQLALASTGLSFIGSATVEGMLGSNLDKTPYRFSEYAGKLRVVTSSFRSGMWGMAANRNRLTVLEPSNVTPGLLKTVAYLPNAARPEVLGAPNEELYATRYVGDKLYAVTFPRYATGPTVDPLYVIDLATPSDPRVRGELIVPGYSDYLHPLDNGLLLGFGRQMSTVATPTSVPVELGLQLSLFDVSDADHPKVLQQVNIGMRGSDSALFKSARAFSIVNLAGGGVQVAFPGFLTGGYPMFGSGDTAVYPWIETSLLRYQVSTTPGSAAIAEAPRIKSEASTSSGNATTDHAANNGRSILFGNGSAIYVGDGWMWYQDALGAKQGPY